MGIVIEVNTLPAVFNKNNCNHHDYRPVLDWIIEDKAKLIVGGTTYFIELKRLASYLKYIEELGKLNKVYKEKDTIVDGKEDKIKNKIGSKKFNDHHFVSLIAATNCKVFCSMDIGAFQLMNDRNVRKFFTVKPKIYTNIDHAPNKTLLCDLNLTSKCKPHFKLSKEQKKSLSFY
jgi:hypothetical protein